MELAGVSAPVPFSARVTDVDYPGTAMEPVAVLPLPLDADPEAACAPIAGESPVARALRAVLPPVVRRVVVAVTATHVDVVTGLVGPLGAEVTAVDPAFDWGRTVRVALEHLDARSHTSILVHDWRHPLVPVEVTERVVAALADGHEVVVPVVAMTDSVKELDVDGSVIATVDRSRLSVAQYPRGFAAGRLADLLDRGSDLLAAALAGDPPVRIVDGHADATRFTLPADAAFLEAIIATRL